MCTCKEKQAIEKRLEQHEQTITQLIGMVAAMNGRLTQLLQETDHSHVRPPAS